MSNPMKPSVSLLVKLGSIAVHADELTSTDGHALDAHAIRGLLDNPEVSAWIRAMSKSAMLPLKRTNPPRENRKGSR